MCDDRSVLMFVSYEKGCCASSGALLARHSACDCYCCLHAGLPLHAVQALYMYNDLCSMLCCVLVLTLIHSVVSSI
jgi:hypothetical protein